MGLMFKRQWESLRSPWAGRQEESVPETKGLAPGEPWERRGGVGAREAGRHELDEGAALWLGQPSMAWPSQLVSSSVFMILFSSQEEPPKHVSHGGKNTSTLLFPLPGLNLDQTLSPFLIFPPSALLWTPRQKEKGSERALRLPPALRGVTRPVFPYCPGFRPCEVK